MTKMVAPANTSAHEAVDLSELTPTLPIGALHHDVYTILLRQKERRLLSKDSSSHHCPVGAVPNQTWGCCSRTC